VPNLVLDDRHADGLGLFRLRFAEALPGHVAPGQFATVHLPGLKPAYFALANGPGEPVELLVKHHGPTAEALDEVPLGTAVEVSAPIGRGFGLDPDDRRPLVALVNGSGISAVRPVIEAEVAGGLRRPVELFYGVYTPAHRSFVDRLEAWAAAGVGVRVVVSEDVPGWTGLRGFVQHAAARAAWVRDDVTVLLVGYPAMIEEARAAWAAAGAVPERLRTNF
jgi:NAD(P)H-flavin reductase